MTLSGKILFVLVLVAVAVTTLVYGAVHPPVIALFYVLTTAMVFLWAIRSASSGEVAVNTSVLQIPLYAAAAYGLIQTIPFGSREIAGLGTVGNTISLDPHLTAVSSLHFLALALFFSVALTVFTTVARLRKTERFIAIFGFVIAFFAILQSFLSPDKIYGIYEVRNAEPFGPFVNRHNFAALMELSLGLPLGVLLAGAVERDQRLLYITAIILMAIALLMSGSRGGLVAMLAEVAVVFILATRARSGREKLIRGAFAAVLLAVVIGGTIYIGGESSLSRVAETAASENVTSNRSQIWSVTGSIIRSGFPLGTGLGAYGMAYTRFDPTSGNGRVEQAHNDYLQVAADAGLVGLVIGAAFLFWLFRVGRAAAGVSNRYRRGVGIGALAACVGVLVHSLFDFVLHTTAISLMFILMMTLLVSSRREFSDDIGPDDRSEDRGRRSADVHPHRRRRSSDRR